MSVDDMCPDLGNKCAPDHFYYEGSHKFIGKRNKINQLNVQQMSKTFLDRLVILDCGLCLINIIDLIPSNDKSGVDDLDFDPCEFFVFLLFKVNLINKLLTVGIVIYRFTLVICSSLVQTPHQRKFLEYCILTFIFLTSFNLTSWAFYYREDYRHFLGMKDIKSFIL